MAQRDRRRMKPSPLHLISAETAQLDNAIWQVPGVAFARFRRISYVELITDVD
jgi:hypothetical protein